MAWGGLSSPALPQGCKCSARVEDGAPEGTSPFITMPPSQSLQQVAADGEIMLEGTEFAVSPIVPGVHTSLFR